MAKLSFRLKKELQDWRQRLPASWRPHFDGVELAFDQVDGDATLAAGEKIWPQEGAGPPGTHVFKAFKGLGPDDVKVVIFGNDPYTRIEQATGRSFEQGDVSSWAKDLPSWGKVSPSYQSILCAACATSASAEGLDLTSNKPFFTDPPPSDRVWKGRPLWWCHVELARGLRGKRLQLPAARSIFKHWAEQGVFWLNTTLTYTKWDDDHRESHRKLWRPFTERVLDVLVETAAARMRPTVFTLWGGTAGKLEEDIVARAKAIGAASGRIQVVKTGHPQWPEGYFGKGNSLARVNQALGDSAIDWV